MSRPKLPRAVRTAITSLASTIADLATLITLVEGFGCAVGVAAFASAMVGAVVGYVLGKNWAFRDRSPVRVRQIAAFALVALGTALFVASCVQLLSGLGVPYLAAKAVAAIAVFAAWSYPAQKRIVFTDPAVSRF